MLISEVLSGSIRRNAHENDSGVCVLCLGRSLGSALCPSSDLIWQHGAPAAEAVDFLLNSPVRVQALQTAVC